nr:SGNH family hydrolase [Bartonella callosciuri]
MFFSLFYVNVLHPTQSEATNFFKWLLQHNEQEQLPQQQPQLIEKRTYKLQKKTIIQKSVQKLKKENAKRILVLGDFVASAVADALKTLFIDNVDIIIIKNTMPASGLVRTDYYSWKDNISALIERNKADIIVILMGANDNQPITSSQNILSTSQPEWISIYKKRITEIAERLHNSGKSWIWMGQPIFKNSDLTQKVKIFNELYKDITEAKGGYFIDIWNGFIDKQGEFSFSGYDTNGKVVRLRTDDGINFTSEGKKKLASYLEKKLKDILYHTFSHENPLFINVNTLNLTQQTQKIERQPPMSLNDLAQQNTHLLKKIDQSSIKRSWFLLNGHQRDRADNFSLP